jgi:TPP-dependent 2-oxoacid decarboxylase
MQPAAELAPTAWTTVGDHLLRRLREAGIRHAFGVPGDFNLNLMQQIEDSRVIEWIGTCNELNAAYAADGYSRINGMAALFVTYGVGALSALNGVAGAASEHVPLICISGALPLVATQRELRMHHTLGDGGRGDFLQAFSQITAAQSVLSPQNAVFEIDRVIRTAWHTKQPVYLEIPSDISYLNIPAASDSIALRVSPSDPERLTTASRAVAERIDTASAPAILVDVDAARHGVAGEIASLAEQLSIPIAVVSTAKAIIDETHPRYLGVYHGASSSAAVRTAIEGSDCLLAIGYRRIDSTSGFFSDALPPDTIRIETAAVDIGTENFQAVGVSDLLDALAETVRPVSTRLLPIQIPAATPDVAESGPLTQHAYWQLIGEFLCAGDVLVAEEGTSAAGAGGLKLPRDCTFITQAVWGSIGFSVGALLGALIAAPERRHLLFVGDGSFQLSAQELSTILRHDLKPVIFLINNGGYTIERTILGKSACYNDIADWSYAELPRVFRPGTNALCRRVDTVEAFRAVLDEAADHDALVFIEAVMDRHDAPPELIAGGHLSAALDYGPRGPQHRAGSQI